MCSKKQRGQIPLWTYTIHHWTHYLNDECVKRFACPFLRVMWCYAFFFFVFYWIPRVMITNNNNKQGIIIIREERFSRKFKLNTLRSTPFSLRKKATLLSTHCIIYYRKTVRKFRKSKGVGACNFDLHAIYVFCICFKTTHTHNIYSTHIQY